MGYKFIVIYSDGPMGSSVVSSLLEKYGYLNLPFRKFYLLEYVMGIKPLNDKSMQLKFLEHLSSLYSNSRIGGTSVQDRNSRARVIRAIKPLSKDIDNFLSYKPDNLRNLLTHCFTFVNSYIIYKPNYLPIRGFIIQEIPKINNPSQSIHDYEYLKKLSNIKDFKCLILNRDFKTWVSSLLSQQDININSFERLKTVSLEKLFKRWKSIQRLSNNTNFITVDLGSILLPYTFSTNIFLSKYFLLKTLSNSELQKDTYDLFGYTCRFKKAFTPSDKSYLDANLILKLILSNYTFLPKCIRRLLDYFFNILRLIGLLRVS